MSPPRTLNIGLIGAGRWGRVYIDTLARLDGLRLARLASRNPDSRALVGADCAVTRSWRALVQAGDLDGVIVATPPALHADMARAAMRAGLPVLVEKPLTADLKQARALLALAEDAGAFAMVDHVHLFHPAYRALKRRALMLGGIQSIRSAGGNRGPFRGDADVLWDWGPHDVAMVLDLVGEMPVNVAAERVKRRKTRQGTGEILDLTLTFADGLQAMVRIGNILDQKTRYLAAHFTRHLLIYDDTDAAKLVEERLTDSPRCIVEEEPPKYMAMDHELPLDRCLLDFADGIRAGSRDLSGLRLGVRVVEVLTRAQEALGR